MGYFAKNVVYLNPSNISILFVNPPHPITVTITIIEVVVKISRLAGVDVFLMARAKAIAPRRPENKSKCCMFIVILFLFDRDKLIKNDNGYMLNALARVIPTLTINKKVYVNHKYFN